MSDWLETRFESLADRLPGLSADDECLLLDWRAERSAFCRFSTARIRQFTEIEQAQARLCLRRGRRTADLSLTLGAADDEAALDDALARLRLALSLLPDDPFAPAIAPVGRSRRDDAPVGGMSAADCAAQIAAMTGDDDLVGHLAMGPMLRGVADSRGMRHFHRVASQHFDFSLHAPRASGEPPAAVKAGVAGPVWIESAFSAELARARERLGIARRTPRPVPPGRYRVYLGPRAVAELLGCLAWGGFSRREHATGTSPLAGLAERGDRLSERFTLSESPARGLAPAFGPDGQPRAAELPLIVQGRLAQRLMSPRSAAEFGEQPNGDDAESPSSLVMAGGDLQADGIGAALGDGLWIDDLWYLNYSDRQSARVTGMSRFAALIVENGRPVAPLAPMRFDESLLHLFGAGLQSLTHEAAFLPDADSYGARSLRSTRCPGMVVEGMRFTL